VSCNQENHNLFLYLGIVEHLESVAQYFLIFHLVMVVAKQGQGIFAEHLDNVAQSFCCNQDQNQNYFLYLFGIITEYLDSVAHNFCCNQDN